MTSLSIPFVPSMDLGTEPQSTQRRRRFEAVSPGRLSFVWLDRWDPERPHLEAFIAQVFSEHYHATLSTFHEVLIGCKDEAGQWVAGLGFSALAHRAAFLEQYLEQPVEQVVQSVKPSPEGVRRITRWDIAEVGNLAALQPGASRALIVKMTEYLHRRHFRWVVFTATKSLVNSFSKLHYDPVELAVADPERLAGDARQWGTYYDHSPRVMVGDIHTAYAKFFPKNA